MKKYLKKIFEIEKKIFGKNFFLTEKIFSVIFSDFYRLKKE